MKAITVESEQANTGFHRRNGILLRAMLIALAMLPAACNKEEPPANKVQPPPETPVVQSEPTPPPPATVVAPPAKPLTDLESLVAPIALYPDPLLAELLVASTYPFEVVQAARWLETKPDLATLNSKDWDASIMRLASVPIVIKMMNDHLDWTTQLGDAFLAKPGEVMASIQALRKRAKDAGFLKDTPEQKVSTEKVANNNLSTEKISIKPAKADTVYVPQYKPEVVYQAPLAQPPATVVNVNAAAPSYYPSYYPPTTTTSSSNDGWMNFATGAVVGGLLTWGIMEWADDNHDYVGHYYGNTVCHSGNCWHGGGGYYGSRAYYGDRGNVNYNKNINISGNEINVDRNGYFSQNNLQPSQLPAGWQADPRHRRGQPYPKAAQQRLGQIQQPALAGQRLGTAQTLPASTRGFGEAGQRTSVGTLPAERRPSSTDIQQQLAQKPVAKPQPQPLPKAAPNRPTINRGQTAGENALHGLRTPGQASQLQSQRGANSRGLAASGGFTKPAQNQLPRAQQATQAARPNAFDMPRNTSATQSFSQRGASSMQRSVSAGSQRTAAGFQGGGGRRR
ncbi:DUF3300 domain-containing protein [Methylomonas sp. MO1]|uniref:DUF3300 domain-containing protein n=1 Tax=Methylomonas sp. MO1 TaxID=3073619 RepID=UPI0028A52459|nr:DUF3300 domain-containing protein [Methylomonas sp. MO1]MDT4290337.1 DUF3300 domain-containing protein [Methylomonas sp. MO1]